MAARYHRLGLLLILTCYLALSTYYNVVIPAWEAHDEWAHFKFVEYVARERSLPPPNVRLTTEYEYDEANQPPLYYMLAAIPVMLVAGDAEYRPEINPYFDLGTGAGGINAAVHHPNAERFPWHGAILALHIARGASVLIGLSGLVAVYALGRLLTPDRPAVWLLGLSLVAFSPQYLFISSVVTNDVLIAALGCFVAWLGIKVAIQGIRPLSGIALAAVTGMAMVTKLSAVSMLPFVALSLLTGAIRARRTGRARWMSVLAFLAPLVGAALAAAWWLRRNLVVTGQLLPRDPWVALRFVARWIEGSSEVHPMHLADLPPALAYGFRTFWASFGWGNLEAPGWVYVVFAVVTLTGMAGWLAWLFSRSVSRVRRSTTCLLVLLIGSLIGIAAYRDFDYGSQLVRGRYVLPALGALASLLAVGLTHLVERTAPKRLWAVSTAIGGALFVLCLLLPSQVILPAYAAPASLLDASLLPGEQPVGARFGDLGELVAYQTRPAAIGQGQALAVTLFWRALGPADRNYTLAVHLQDARQRLVGELNVYPGRGNYATSLWQAGTLFRETHWIPLREAIDQPILGDVKVAFFNTDPAGGLLHLPVTDPGGRDNGDALVIGRYRLDPGETREIERGSYLAEFDETIRLETASWDLTNMPVVAGESFTVTLSWIATGRPSADFSVFVHLEGPDSPVGFGDSPPNGGLLPTDLWVPRDTIEDDHLVQVSDSALEGEYRLLIGLYDKDGRRALARDFEGRPLDEGALAVGEISVRRLRLGGYLPLLSAGAGLTEK